MNELFFIEGGVGANGGWLTGQSISGIPEWTADRAKRLLMPIDEALHAARRIHRRGQMARVIWSIEHPGDEA